MLHFITKFLLLSGTFFYLLSIDSLQASLDLFNLFLAHLSFFLIQGFDSQITLNAAVLRHGSGGFALEVTRLCNALSISALWCAALLAYPLGWRKQLAGLLLGLVLIQFFNVLRLISLLYLGVWLERPHFDLIHEQFWPLLLHLLIIIGFAFWLVRGLRTTTTTTETHTNA